jgi:hypothetical protein
MPSHLRPRHKVVRERRMTVEPPSQAETGAKSRSPLTLWAYTYQIVPPQTRIQLRPVRAFLDQEHSAAVGASGTFAGRLIVGRQLTRLLIVSDCPERTCPVNQRLEAELGRLEAEFAVSEPVALPGKADAP